MKLKKSAGILLSKRVRNQLFVLLVHPSGPFWKNKDRDIGQYQKGNLMMKKMHLTPQSENLRKKLERD